MFSRGFKAAKCKTLLKLALSRIKLLRNKRDVQLRSMRRDIANLLQTGQEPSARIRIEHVYREQNIVAAYEIVELFCELVVVRLPIIESQKICPLDLKEAIASLIFAAPRCSDLPELLEARNLFTIKYGKEFVASAAELRPDCGVNRRIIEKLSVRAPSGEVKLKLLKEIATEHNVDWDATETEAELLKQHEDLLNGPSQFTSHSQNPLPSQVIHSQTPSPPPNPLDELPSVPLRAPSNDSPPIEPAKVFIPPPSPPQNTETPPDNSKQYVPFLSPPSFKSSDAPVSSPVPTPKQDPTPTHSNFQKELEKMDYQEVVAAAHAAAESAERAALAARAAANLAKQSSVSSVRPPQEDSSDSEAEEPEVSSRFRQTSFPKSPSTNRVETSSSDDEDDGYYGGTSKPVGEPQFDAGEEDDDAFWRRQISFSRRDSRTKSPPPRISQTESSDLFDTEEKTLRDEATSPFQDSNFGTTVPSYDTQPQFDEAESDPEEVFPSVPRSNSIPPQRAPPELPSRPSLSSSDSGSGSFGHSAHPKLPDYDDLTARFQALRSRR